MHLDVSTIIEWCFDQQDPTSLRSSCAPASMSLDIDTPYKPSTLYGPCSPTALSTHSNGLKYGSANDSSAESEDMVPVKKLSESSKSLALVIGNDLLYQPEVRRSLVINCAIIVLL